MTLFILSIGRVTRSRLLVAVAKVGMLPPIFTSKLYKEMLNLSNDVSSNPLLASLPLYYDDVIGRLRTSLLLTALWKSNLGMKFLLNKHLQRI